MASVINIVARGKGRIGDRKQVKMQPGKPLLILSPVPLSRFNLYAFIDALAGRNLKDNNALNVATVCISRGLDAQPGGSLNELLAIPDDATEDTISACLQAVELPADIDREQLLTMDSWRQFPKKTRASILLQQACHAPAPLVLVDATVLGASSADYAAGWLEAMVNNKVGIVSGNLQDLQQYNGKAIVLMAQDRSVSIANTAWCQENMTAIDAWLHLADMKEDRADDELFEDE